ncbi:PhaM family polyhydroxyalkanoate granule multifunctional regulatory protein [Trinickia acidisoli]|uniref:PhaM family polyhydroxyalkanoate granule multifunctional regulatory protein n=1 Tax=Trinickia acidisoli TaxID=2767482 RepID=UPI001A8F7EB0|nr:PhaM family polyhydroxyalkanoate granule multifunctional regulatory protein [Trinickia acidisoli]
MTDTAGDKPPFPGFPGFPPAEMLDKMWDMMRLTPFGAAFPGMQPGTAQGFGSPLTAMSDMMSPLMNVEELDKRITDMRAVEQWLKLNLNMLQSAIQALEVQRSTLATLRAFGAFAQASMTQPPERAQPAATKASSSSPWGASAGSAPASSRPSDAGGSAGSTGGNADAAGDTQGSGTQADEAGNAAFDPAGWWNLLQSQFNQLAAFAMTQPGSDSEAGAKAASPKQAGGARAQGAKAQDGSAASTAKPAKPAAKRAPARKSGANSPTGSSSGAARGEK